MSGHNSSNLSSLDYQVWGNAGVLTTPATKAKTSSRVLKCTKYNVTSVEIQQWNYFRRKKF